MYVSPVIPKLIHEVYMYAFSIIQGDLFFVEDLKLPSSLQMNNLKVGVSR